MLTKAFIACGVVIMTATAIHAQGPQGGTSFVDNFTKFNPAFWYVSDGWNNGSFQNCTWSQKQVRVEGGYLSLTFEKGETPDREYLCGEVQTIKRYGYGTFEARLKSATGSGLNSAFFSYIGPIDKEVQDEIDFEILGKNLSQVQVNQYVKAKGGNEKLIEIGSQADQGFNDYAFVWEPGRLRFFVNGKLARDVTDPSKVPTQPQKIFFSLWGTDTFTDWMGKFSYSRPVTLNVDWVAFTAAGDKCQFPESIVCSLE